MLILLIDQRPQTLSHEQVSSEMWRKKRLVIKHVARAVMEARRAIGDDPDAPRHILSVRGVGYRFAAEVSHADIGSTPPNEGADVGGREARVDIDAAAACMRRGHFQDGRRLADRAIATADLADARPELAQALALAASLQLRIGGHERALTLANKAMRMAQLGGRDDVIADARLGLAEIQLWLGSAHAALDLLLAAHRVLAAHGSSFGLWRCESLLSMTYREIGRCDDAWPWCERALASALKMEPEGRALRERLAMVGVLQVRMEAAETDGMDDQVQAIGLRALGLLNVVESDARAVGATVYILVSLTYRAITLEFMGRVSEGWAVIEQLRPALFGASVAPAPWLELRRREFLEAEAGLLSQMGRSSEALQTLERAMSAAPILQALTLETASAQGLAARLCERAGRYKEAMVWRRRQLHTTNRLQADKAQATAGIVRAQLESDRLGEDLAQARAEIAQLQQLNHGLERRILQMERHDLMDESGLVPAAALAATVDARAALARERELPLCIGVVELSAPTDAAGVDADLVMRRRLKLLSSTLKALIPEASAAAQWRAGLCFFVIADLGLGPARQRCQVLAQRLNAQAMPTTPAKPVVNVRIDAVDVTRFNSIEAAMAQMPSLAVPGL